MVVVTVLLGSRRLPVVVADGDSSRFVMADDGG